MRRLYSKRRWSKGEMSRTIVIYCVKALTYTLLWAIALKTLGAVFGWIVDLTDVLTFTAASFGGELLLLAFKRVFTDKKKGGSGDEPQG